MSVTQAWNLGLRSEVAYWDAWLGSRGVMWASDPIEAAEEFRARFDNNTPLQPELQALVQLRAHSGVHILDVGAGPATVVGRAWRSGYVQIKAIDALANEYDALLMRHGLVPPVRTELGLAEGLPLDDGMLYDIAYSRNALDHCYNPVRAIEGMIQSVRHFDGFVYLLHHENEATRRNFHGLHQWNFALEGNDLIATSAGMYPHNVTQLLAGMASCRSKRVAGSDLIEVIFNRY